MLGCNQPADYRLLPDRETDTVPQLKRERRLLVGEAEFLRPRKCLGDLSRRGAGRHPADGIVEVITAASIGVDQCRRRASNRKRAVVAGAVSVVGVQDIEEHRITRSHHAVAVDVRMGMGPLTRDGVDPFDVFRAWVMWGLGEQASAIWSF